MNSFDAARITTQRLFLAPLHPHDAEAMVEVLGDERLHEFIGGRPASPAELASRYARLAAGSGDAQEVWLNWIVRRRADNKPIGTVQATVSSRADGARRQWTAQIAWIIGVPWQGQGFAAEAAQAMVGWLRGQGATELTANIHPEHRASAAVAARVGLTQTAEEVDGELVWRALSS